MYYNQLPPPRGQHPLCHEMSESRRLVKLKDLKKEIFPFKPMATHNYSISSRSRVHPPGNSPCIPPHNSLPIQSYHAPFSLFFSDIQTSLLQAELHAAYPLNDYQHISYIDPLSNPVVLRPLHMAKPSENTINLFV